MQPASVTWIRVLGAKPLYQYAITYFPASADLAGAAQVEVRAGSEMRDRTFLVRAEQSHTISVTLRS
jgi:hypothetical protein